MRVLGGSNGRVETQGIPAHICPSRHMERCGPEPISRPTTAESARQARLCIDHGQE